MVGADGQRRRVRLSAGFHRVFVQRRVVVTFQVAGTREPLVAGGAVVRLWSTSFVGFPV